MVLQPQGKRYHGINFNGQYIGDRAYALEVAQSIDAMSYTSMDDYSFTKDLQAVVPDALVSHRSWNPFFVDDDTKDYMSVDAIKYADRISSGIDPQTMVHLYNEPSNDNVPGLVDRCIEAMNHCGVNGPNPQRLLVGNFAADKSWSHNGQTIRFQDEWLRLGEAFQRHIRWHTLGMTRYWMGDYRASLVQGYPHNLLDDNPAWLDAQNFVAPLFGRLPNGDLPPTWHGHAYLWLFTIWHERGWDIPHFKAQETFLDEKWDSGSELIQAYLSANYSTGGYNNGIQRGIWTWGDWLEQVSGMPYVDALKLQLEAMTWEAEQQAKHPALVGKDLGVNSFQWTTAEDWEKAGHSIAAPRHGEGVRDGSKRRQFHIAMGSTKRIYAKDVIVDIPNLPEGFDWHMRPASVSSAGVKVRSSWSTQNEENVLFVLREEQTVQASKNSFHNPNNGFDWLRIIFKDTVIGYIAKPYVDVKYDPVVDTPPVVEPDAIEAAVFKWLETNTDISETIVEDVVKSYLDENAERLFGEAVVENSDTLIDKLVKVVFREWSTHIPVQEQPDMPAPLMAFISRFFGFIAKVSAPPTD